MKRLLAITFLASACDLQPANVGTFNLKNDSAATIDFVVSDEQMCVIGLHSAVATHTWRNYDITDKDKGAFLCLAGNAFPVAHGKSYAFDGTSLVEVPPP